MTCLQQNTVVVVSGESGRHGYFTAKGLDLTEGFKILSGAVRDRCSHPARFLFNENIYTDSDG